MHTFLEVAGMNKICVATGHGRLRQLKSKPIGDSFTFGHLQKSRHSTFLLEQRACPSSSESLAANSVLPDFTFIYPKHSFGLENDFMCIT